MSLEHAMSIEGITTIDDYSMPGLLSLIFRLTVSILHFGKKGKT